MATLRIDTLDFHFQPEIDARKYDHSRHYIEVVRQKGKRAVDVVAVEMGSNPQRSWNIEVKDYRVIQGQPKDFAPSEIAEDVFRKVSDTREGLSDAAANAADAQEKSHASRSLSAQRCQIVFHLEPYAGPASRLFPRDPTAGVYQKLKQLFGPTDPPLLVLKIETTRRASVPWTTS
jgi:hypothetical protein